MDQSNDEGVSLRVNGEIFSSILKIKSIVIKNVVCVGHITGIDGDSINIQLDGTHDFKYKLDPKAKIENPSNNYYQFSINVKNNTIEYIFDFGADFDYYSYQTTYFNYWYILTNRYPQLRGEAPMDQ